MLVRGRIARRAGALCGAAAMALLASAASASAHETSLSLGANTATVSSDHTQVVVCDNEDDGRPVFAEFAGHPLGGPPDQHFDAYGGGCSTFSRTGIQWGYFWSLCEPYGPCTSAVM
jgi:hypothetical protein